MSYCRWSSDNWKCDLYCYFATWGEYVTHVATCRYKDDIPIVPDILNTPRDEWTKAHKVQMDFLEIAEKEPIGLPYDDMTFEDSTVEDFLARLKHLKETGYHVPDFVIESVEGELKDENRSNENH